jgi:glyoxylase-like metal-dependent hydrolase (beta-lactamase superfamily II)
MTGTALPFTQSDVVIAQSAKLDRPVTTQRLSGKVALVMGPDGNALVVDSSEGLILVDGGHTNWHDSLHAAIAQQFPGRPYRALFNTHWHREQTGSNLSLGRKGVQIIAHENTMLWESTEISQRWSGQKFAPLPKAALPVTTFYEDGAIQIGDRHIQYGYLRDAHTDGDIWIYFADENVLATGGLVNNGAWSEPDWWTGGFIGGMLDGFVSLLTVPDINTKIVPASGAVMNLSDLRAQNQRYLTVFDRIHGAFIQSKSLSELLQEKPADEFTATMGNPTKFLTLAFQSIQGHLRDPQNDRILNLP